MLDPQELPHRYKNKEKEFKALFKTFNKKNARVTDKLVHALHDEAFEKIDCLECANCCRSLGPRITDRDIEKMGKALRIKPTEVVEQYLRVDEDGDFVFKEMPCPFLAADNYCMIYENRPKACREYPHTDRTNFYQVRNITLKNCSTCPAVFQISEELSKRLK